MKGAPSERPSRPFPLLWPILLVGGVLLGVGLYLKQRPVESAEVAARHAKCRQTLKEGLTNGAQIHTAFWQVPSSEPDEVQYELLSYADYGKEFTPVFDVLHQHFRCKVKGNEPGMLWQFSIQPRILVDRKDLRFWQSPMQVAKQRLKQAHAQQ